MNNKKKLNLVIIGILIVLASISLSYAYWQMTLMGDKGNNVTSGCFNIEMINQKDEITLGSTFPITDEEGLKLKPFSFTLKNTCTIFAHYYVNMEMLEGTTLNSKFVAVRVNNEEINTLDTYKTVSTTIDGSTESRTIAEGYLGADEEIDYTVSFWMDEDVTIDDDVMNKTFKSKIVINSEPGKYDPVSAGYDTLHDAILANEYQTTPEIAKNKIASKQEVDLSNTAPIIKWVEKVGEGTTKEIAKPSESVIEMYNKDSGTGDRTTQASNLTLDDTKIRLYKSKSFNQNTSRYSLSDMIIVDPTTLNYSESTKYYFADENISYSNNKLTTWNSNGNVKIYEIIGATKTNSKTTWNNIIYDSVTYRLNAVELSSSQLEADKSDKGLYQATDDYGTTYYYRGNVKNNNVYFAGFYWQIVRINGEDSIRLIYNGTEKNAVGINQSIKNETYQFNNFYNNISYAGYMYGNPEGATFDQIHANVNDSAIKIKIDEWYKENILDKNYENYVNKNVGFCGDRSINDNSIGDGVNTNQDTRFGAYTRFASNTAQFICPEQSRDLYTTDEATSGNNALTYPVGLITYDEIVFAGVDQRHTNKLSWIYSTTNFWTMSPSYYSSKAGVVNGWINNADGYLFPWNWITSKAGVRPVINLKSDVKITGGTGTANDPFVVDTNN